MSSLGLLGAAYGSSDDSSSGSDDEGEKRMQEEAVNAEKTKQPQESLANPFGGSASKALPKPSFMQASKDFSEQKSAHLLGAANSVFFNPFKAREAEKKAILEQHVSVTTRQEEMRTINGKKVCWNFRKGRCRFGHNCSFAHDSDIGLKKPDKDAEAAATTKQEPRYKLTTTTPKPSLARLPAAEKAPEYDSNSAVMTNNVKTKRPGLSDGIVPSKKAMKFHKKVYNDSEGGGGGGN